MCNHHFTQGTFRRSFSVPEPVEGLHLSIAVPEPVEGLHLSIAVPEFIEGLREIYANQYSLTIHRLQCFLPQRRKGATTATLIQKGREDSCCRIQAFHRGIFPSLRETYANQNFRTIYSLQCFLPQRRKGATTATLIKRAGKIRVVEFKRSIVVPEPVEGWHLSIAIPEFIEGLREIYANYYSRTIHGLQCFLPQRRKRAKTATLIQKGREDS